MDVLDGKPLINQKKRVILANEALKKAKMIVFLFSAGWCTTCEDLIKKLVKVHEESKKHNMGLEIVNVPSDTNLKDFMEHFKTQGNWYSLIFGDTLAQELVWMYDIIHLPSIIVTARNGTIITKNGYNELMKIGKNVIVTWQST